MLAAYGAHQNPDAPQGQGALLLLLLLLLSS
jgi:hypothetical protein